MKSKTLVAISVLMLAMGQVSAQIPLPAASYYFNNTLAAQEGGVPALVPTDPLGTNGYLLQSVFGQNRTVYAFNGNAIPNANQAGLTLNTTGLVDPINYSAELVFQFTERPNSWRRIIDVTNRQSDTGFYVNPTNNLAIFPTSGSSSLFTNDVYHHVVLTVTSGSTANGYLDGVLQFSTSTALMNINNVDNPGNLLHLFIDNVVNLPIDEYSSGDIALFRLYDAVLSDTDVQTLAAAPFAVPEPSTVVLASLAIAGFVGYRRLSNGRLKAGSRA
ncbi:MAG: hypothetical protein QM703_09865 [Gemmatales bacterium]